MRVKDTEVNIVLFPNPITHVNFFAAQLRNLSLFVLSMSLLQTVLHLPHTALYPWHQVLFEDSAPLRATTSVLLSHLYPHLPSAIQHFQAPICPHLRIFSPIRPHLRIFSPICPHLQSLSAINLHTFPASLITAHICQASPPSALPNLLFNP